MGSFQRLSFGGKTVQFKTIPLVFLLSPLAVAMVCHGQELKLAVTEATAGWETAGSATADSAMAALETTDWEIPEWISSETTIAPTGRVADPPALGVPPDVTDASMSLPPDSYSQIDYPAESITPHFGITDEEKAKASGWRFGGEFLIAEREESLPLGRQYGFRISVDQENEWADKPTTDRENVV